MRINFTPIINHKKQFQIKNNPPSRLTPLSFDSFSFQAKDKTIYAIDFNGEIRKYPNINAASKDIGCSPTAVCDIIAGRRNCTDGFVFAKAKDIEIKDKNDDALLDCNKINKLRERFLYSGKNYPIVLISEDGKTEIYETVKTASNETHLPSSSFFRALAQPKYAVGSRAIAKLSDVVLKDKNGNVVFDDNGNFTLDDEKLTKFYSAYFCKRKPVDSISFTSAPKRIYAFDYEGNMYHFNNREEASKAIGMSKCRITDSIYDKQVACGYLFVNANQLEIDGLDDKKILDTNKIKDLMQTFSRTNNMPVCTIDFNGTIQRYLNPKDMEKKSGIPQNKTSDILNRDSHYYETKGILIVRENDILLRDEHGKIQKDANGNYRYDLEKVSKLMEAFLECKIKPVIAKNTKTDEVLTFKSATDASRYFKVSKQAVDACLKDISHTCSGYHFSYYNKNTISNFLGL